MRGFARFAAAVRAPSPEMRAAARGSRVRGNTAIGPRRLRKQRKQLVNSTRFSKAVYLERKRKGENFSE